MRVRGLNTHRVRDVPEVDPDAVHAHRVGRAPAVQPQRQLVQRGGRVVRVRGVRVHVPRARAPCAERERLRVARAHRHPRVVGAGPRRGLA